jgi:hypothetical protein
MELRKFMAIVKGAERGDEIDLVIYKNEVEKALRYGLLRMRGSDLYVTEAGGLYIHLFV